jgi:hypothetical protein
MLFNFLPGQEEGNVPFVIKNGFGDYSKEPDTIARVRHGRVVWAEALGGLSGGCKLVQLFRGLP